MAQNITVRKLELELEADINIASVWGTGHTSIEPAGFNAVRVHVHLDADAPRNVLDRPVKHATQWSPIANTFAKPAALAVDLAK